jgi:hypothetical protein
LCYNCNCRKEESTQKIGGVHGSSLCKSMQVQLGYGLESKEGKSLFKY